MADILETSCLNGFSWMKIIVFWFKFHWSLLVRAQMIMSQHWLRWWLDTEQKACHCLNQWRLIYIYIFISIYISRPQWVKCIRNFKNVFSVCDFIKNNKISNWIGKQYIICVEEVQLCLTSEDLFCEREFPGGQFVDAMSCHVLIVLTHLALDKMAAISQRTFTDAFSWMKSLYFD